MHLVTDEDRSLSSRQGDGFAGWLIEVLQAVWLRAKVRHDAKRQMFIIENLSLGSRKQLLLVSCAGEQFLVGTGAESVHTIVRVGAETDRHEQQLIQSLGERT